MKETYYILEECNHYSYEVSKEEHSEWKKKNAKRYDCDILRRCGQKSLTMTFIGIRRGYEELVLFTVRINIFSRYDEKMLSTTLYNFSDYREADSFFQNELFFMKERKIYSGYHIHGIYNKQTEKIIAKIY